jgi:hypothetical protein
MRMSRFVSSVALATAVMAGALTVATRASASTTTYSTWADYNAATTGNQTITFDGLGIAYWDGNPTGLTQSGVAFTQPDHRLFTFSPSFYATTGLTSDYLNLNSNGSVLNITLPAPIFAFATDVGSLENFGNTSDPTITFNFTGGTGSITLNNYLSSSANTLAFFGISSTTSFSSITINDPTNGLILDNFTFTIEPAASATPLPAALPLFATGLGALGLLGWRRKRKGASAIAA